MKHAIIETLKSLGCVLAGWLAGSIAAAIVSGWHPVREDNLSLLFSGRAAFAAILSGPPLLLCWILIVIPLYVFVPAGHRAWDPRYCVPCGSLIGVCAEYVYFGFRTGSWSLQPIFLGGYFIVGVVFGATPSFLASLFKRRVSGNIRG